MFIARHQLFLTNAKRICKERKKVGRHITVVHKTSYRTYLTLLYLFLQLLYHVLCRNIVYKHIGISRYLTAEAAIYIVAEKDFLQMVFYDIFKKHHIVIAIVRGQLHKTRSLTVWHFYNVIFGIAAFARNDTHGQIQTTVAQEHAHLIFLYLDGLQKRKYLFGKVTLQIFFMKLFYFTPRLIEYNVILTQSRQYALLVNAHTVIKLKVDDIRYLVNNLVSLIYSLILALSARSHRLMLGYTYFVELFQIRRIN